MAVYWSHRQRRNVRHGKTLVLSGKAVMSIAREIAHKAEAVKAGARKKAGRATGTLAAGSGSCLAAEKQEGRILWLA
jgi:hypothetical protein